MSRLNTLLQSNEDNSVFIETPKKKTKFFQKIFKKEEEIIIPDIEVSIKTEEELEIEEWKRLQEEYKRNKRWNLTTRIINISLIIGCLYTLFLIYGAAITQYHYTENGEIEVQRLSISDYNEKSQFDILLGQYMKCQVLYQKILLLNYRYTKTMEGSGEDSLAELGAEYNSLLDEVEQLNIANKALALDSKYIPIQNMISTWLSANDGSAKSLCSLAASDLTTGGSLSEKAYSFIDIMLTDFTKITSNIIETGKNINGVDCTAILKFNPNTYAETFIKGA